MHHLLTIVRTTCSLEHGCHVYLSKAPHFFIPSMLKPLFKIVTIVELNFINLVFFFF